MLEDNEKTLPLLTPKDLEHSSNLSLNCSSVGSGKTYLVAEQLVSCHINNHPYIYFTNSVLGIETILGYMKSIILKNHCSEEIIKDVYIHASHNSRELFKNFPKFILTVHNYLGYKGFSIEYFSLMTYIIHNARNGLKYKVYIDESHLFIHNTLTSSIEIQSVYKKYEQFDNPFFLYQDKVSLTDLVKNVNIHFYDTFYKVTYNKTYNLMDIFRLNEVSISEALTGFKRRSELNQSLHFKHLMNLESLGAQLKFSDVKTDWALDLEDHLNEALSRKTGLNDYLKILKTQLKDSVCYSTLEVLP